MILRVVVVSLTTERGHARVDRKTTRLLITIEHDRDHSSAGVLFLGHQKRMSVSRVLPSESLFNRSGLSGQLFEKKKKILFVIVSTK